MVITISREYGAYGRSVAKALSQKLGIEFYDVDFIRMTVAYSDSGKGQHVCHLAETPIGADVL